jgi:pilus assembly protein Flp/PilA
MLNRIRKVKKPKLRSSERRGQGLTEYAMILSLVAVVVIVILAVLGPAIGNVFSNIVYHTSGYSTAEDPPESPPECYGSLLLPLMVGSTGLVVGISTLLPRRATAIARV